MSGTATAHTLETDGRQQWLNPAWLLAGAVLLGHAPLAILHLRSLWLREQYQYFPFVIGAIVWLLWSRWQESDPPATPARRWMGLPELFAIGAVVLLVGAIVTVSPWVAFVSLNVGLAAVFALIGRQRAIPYLWGIWLLLWLLVPLPLNVDERLVRSLQRLSSQLSSAILDLFGILHLMSGNVLRLPDKQFFVDEACSGIISVMSMIACAMIYAVWKNRSFLHLLALVVAGITWALVLNVLRICIIAGAYRFLDIDLSTGTVHEVLGLVLFLLMFVSLVSTDYLLEMFFAPINLEHLSENGQDNRLVQLWNRFSQPTTSEGDTTGDVAKAVVGLPRLSTAITWALPFLLLGIVQLIWLPSSETPEVDIALKQALALDEQSLPKKIGPWVLDSHEKIERESLSEFGRYSQSYRYRHSKDAGVTASVSLDFPYQGGWHDLCLCYRNSGWTVEDRVVESNTKADLSDWKFVAGDLEDSAMGRAFVTFAGFDATGDTAEPASDAVLFRPWFRLRRRLLLNIAPQLFQVQVFAQVASAKDQALKDELELLLLESRRQFRDLVAVREMAE